jgi:hypothetical protein
MARHEDVHTGIWVEPPFSGLSAPAKLLYLWSFTSSHCRMAGLYKIGVDVMARESGLTDRATEKALTELREADLLHYREHVVWVRSRVKYLRNRTANIAKSIRADVELLDEDHPLRVAFLEKYGSLSWLKDVLGDLA